jgi:alternate signal-mediated exported protein
MKNKKPIIALGALAVIGLIAGTIAYFTSEATFDNEFKTALYRTRSTETFEAPSNWLPGQKIDKTLVTRNEGNISVAVRVKMTEKWEVPDSNSASGYSEASQAVINNLKTKLAANPDATNNTDLVIIGLDNQEDWTKSGDYYYFNRELAPVEGTVYDTTSSPIKDVTLNPAIAIAKTTTEETDDTNHTKSIIVTTSIEGLAGARYTLTLDVETVQFDQYQTAWNTNVEIEALPSL